MRRSLDTSSDAQQRRLEIYRAMSRAQRLELAATMTDEVMALAASGILVPEQAAGPPMTFAIRLEG